MYNFMFSEVLELGDMRNNKQKLEDRLKVLKANLELELNSEYVSWLYIKDLEENIERVEKDLSSC